MRRAPRVPAAGNVTPLRQSPYASPYTSRRQTAPTPASAPAPVANGGGGGSSPVDLMQQLQRHIQDVREECFGDGPGSLGLPDTAQVIYSYFSLRAGQERPSAGPEPLTEPDVSRLARQLQVPQEVKPTPPQPGCPLGLSTATPVLADQPIG